MFLHVLRLPQVAAITALSTSTIKRSIKSGDFPAAIQISDKAFGWKSTDIENWIESRPLHSSASDQPVLAGDR